MATSIAELAAQLGGADLKARAAAAEELSRRGPEAAPAAVELAAATGDAESREWAVAALEDCGPPPVESLPRLVSLLDSPSLDISYWAATLLGRLSSAASAAAPALARAMSRSPHPSVKERIAWALGEIGSSDAAVRAALTSAAQSADLRLSRRAREALAQIDSLARR